MSSPSNSWEKLDYFNYCTSIDLSHYEKVREACKCFQLSDEDLNKLMKCLNKSFEAGLDPKTASNATVPMLLSYVRSVPNGTELGDFLALDLGGTNFRVLHIQIVGNETIMTSKIFIIPEKLKKRTGKELFDHIAECLAVFIKENGLMDQNKLPLGFTFSFACKQEGLSVAKLVSWSKGFQIPDMMGKDVAQLLREALIRRGDIDVNVVAVLNDTVGTMMACAFQENTCKIGVIIGTGTNACYMERLENIKKLENKDLDNLRFPEMCINTEWGGFGDDGVMDFVRTPYDKLLDQTTINAGKHLFEKMISGMYMGELVRVVLEKLARDGCLFKGNYKAISKPGCFPTKFISEIENEMQEAQELQFLKTQEILGEIGISVVSITDCVNVSYVCSMVSTRAAHLCACAITTLLERMKQPYVTIGVDGSVFRFHPTFKDNLDKKIDELLDPKYEFQLMLSEDGSGRGAAMVAAVATRHKKETTTPFFLETIK